MPGIWIFLWDGVGAGISAKMVQLFLKTSLGKIHFSHGEKILSFQWKALESLCFGARGWNVARGSVCCQSCACSCSCENLPKFGQVLSLWKSPWMEQVSCRKKSWGPVIVIKDCLQSVYIQESRIRVAHATLILEFPNFLVFWFATLTFFCHKWKLKLEKTC